jgi:hypothetical protein
MHDDTRQSTSIDAAIDDVARTMTRGEPGARFRRGVAERIRAPRPLVTVPRLAAVTAALTLIGFWIVQQVREAQPIQPVRQVQQAQPREGGPVQQAADRKGREAQAVRIVRPARIAGGGRIAIDAPNLPAGVPGMEPVVVAPVVIEAIDIVEDLGPPSLTVPEIVVEPLNVEPLGVSRH